MAMSTMSSRLSTLAARAPRMSMLETAQCDAIIQALYESRGNRYKAAEMLGIPASDIDGVATFYNRIYRQSVGRHVISVCDSIGCFLTGYEEVGGEFRKQLAQVLGERHLRLGVAAAAAHAALLAPIRG